MKHFTIEATPPTSNGIMLAALSGPHDAAEAATTALEHLLQQEGAVRFAKTNPDGLYIYSSVLPRMERSDDRVRVHWPRLELHHSPQDGPPGPVFLTGCRPHMGLLELATELGRVARLCGVRNLVHLTSGYGERAHTRPTIISAMATTPEENQAEVDCLLQQMRPEPLARPLEDPFLVQACLMHRLGYLAVCGHVPPYLGAAPNHQVAAELARRVRPLTGDPGMPLPGLEQQEAEFQQALRRAVAEDQLLANMTLLAEQEEDQLQGAEEAQDRNGLEDTTNEIERFLRREREDQESDGRPD